MTTRKIPLFAAITMALVSGSAFAAQTPYATFTGAGAVGNFTWLYADGFGTGANGDGFTYGTANDVTFTWDGTLFTSSADYTGPGGASNATISSPTPLFGLSWTAQTVQIFGPGTYSFDASLGGGNPETGMLSMTVGAGQLGVHMLMNWSTNNNIDIVNVWNLNSTFSNCGSSSADTAAENCLYTGGNNPAVNNASTVFLFASTDDDGDGTLGVPMVAGGPFGAYGGDPGHNFNFNLHGTMTAPQVLAPVPAAVWLFGSGLLSLLGFVRIRSAQSKNRS